LNGLDSLKSFLKPVFLRYSREKMYPSPLFGEALALHRLDGQDSRKSFAGYAFFSFANRKTAGNWLPKDAGL